MTGRPPDLDPLTVREKESAVLSGALDGVAGPIADAPPCVFSQVATHQDHQFLGVALTGPDGRYRFAIGAGSSRNLTVAYKPDQRELTATASVKTKVRPTLQLRSRLVKNGDVAVFTGSIPGPDNTNVVVGLEAKSGKAWRVFRLYRTRKAGASSYATVLRKPSHRPPISSTPRCATKAATPMRKAARGPFRCPSLRD